MSDPKQILEEAKELARRFCQAMGYDPGHPEGDWSVNPEFRPDGSILVVKRCRDSRMEIIDIERPC